MRGTIACAMTEATAQGTVSNTVTMGSFEKTTGKWLETYRGQVQMIYLDPPFFTGRQFVSRVQTEEHTFAVEAYHDKWESLEVYLSEMQQALLQAHELLSPTGTIFLHVDYRTSAWMRINLDEIFGADRFINEIIWAYESGGRARKCFPRKHDTIYAYAKGRKYYFDLSAVPCGTRGDLNRNHMRKNVDEKGRSYRAIQANGKEYRYYDDEPVYPTDVWTDISHLQQKDPERSGYDTQKPLKLLKRIIASASREGDLVADFFAGSGTTGVAGAQMGRRFLLGDQGSAALLTMDNRLTAEGTPFLIQAKTVEDSTIIDVDVKCDNDRITVRLSDFDLPEISAGRASCRAALCGLAAADHWSLGLLDGEAYVRLSSNAKPRQALTAAVSGKDSRNLAVMIWDYLGARRCYRIPVCQETV